MNKACFQLSASLSVLLLLAACDGGASKAARDNSAAFTASADALAAKLKTGQLPPASDPSVKAFEAQSAKALTSLGTPELPVQGFDSFQQLCGKTSEVVSGYINAGASGAQQAETMNRNLQQLIDNLFSGLLFSAHCTAAHLPFIEKEVGDKMAGKEAPLQQVRNGAMGQAGGLIEMAGATDLSAERRGRVLDLLGTDAGKFAVALNAGQRQQLASAAEAARATLPEDKRGQVDKIKAAFTGAPCGPLCKM